MRDGLPWGAVQSIPRALRRALVGKPIHNERFSDAVLPKRTALPVFSADALSSVAYAPDEIILTLALAGTTAVAVSPWVGLAVLVVLTVVITAYRQNVRAYPSGGGDYEIVSKNLGRTAGVGVGAALMADYALVVAVSMATAAQDVTAALPALAGRRVELAVAGILFVGLLNLRGLKFMGRAAAVPTYFFLAVLTALLLVGLGQDLTGSLGDAPSAGREVLPAAGFDAGLAGLAGALVVLRPGQQLSVRMETTAFHPALHLYDPYTERLLNQPVTIQMGHDEDVIRTVFSGHIDDHSGTVEDFGQALEAARGHLTQAAD